MSYFASFLFGSARSISGEKPAWVDEFETSVKCMDSKHLLEVGRELVQEGDYARAEIAFNQLYKTAQLREASKIYLDLLILKKTILLTKSSLFGKFSQKKIPDLEFMVKCEPADQVLECMISSTQMYSEGKISREDLLTIERIIDETPFSEITIPNRQEFNKLYGRFKEYAYQVFSREK
jgi:hypothetical protein